MSAIEKELVEASSFEPRKNLERQDYLASLARAINEVPEDEFDALSTEAQDWFNDAVRALNKKKDLPDFPDLAEADDEEAQSDDGASSDEEPDSTEETDSDSDDADDDGGEPEEAGPVPAKPTTGKKAGKSKAGKTVGTPEETTEGPASSSAPKPNRRGKGVPPRKLPHPPVGETDKYGVGVNSKGHAALVMLEKGCRMSDVTESIGGTYYNLLQKVVKAGHKVEKAANGLITVIHADNIPKKGKAKK